MADPLGIIAVVVGITAAAAQSSKTLLELVDDIKGGPQEIKTISRDTRAFYAVVFSLNIALQGKSVRDVVGDDNDLVGMLRNLRAPLNNCQAIVGELLLKIRERLKPSSDGKGLQMSAVDLKWELSTKSEVKDLQLRFEAAKSTLDSALGAVTTVRLMAMGKAAAAHQVEDPDEVADASFAIRQYVEDSVKTRLNIIFTRLERDKQSKILQWISPIPYQDSHAAVRRFRTLRTGRWILDHSRFCEWRRSASSSILWLHGIPVAGKTTLVSTVIDNMLDNLPRNSDEAMAYFYCDRNRDTYPDAPSILSNFARQLSLSKDEQRVQRLTVQLYDQKQETGFASSRSTFLESQAHIQLLTDQYAQTYIILDAMDECDQSTRTELVTFFNELIKNSSKTVKIFVSSRPDFDLRIEFGAGPNLEIKAVDNHDAAASPGNWVPVSHYSDTV